MVIKPLKLKGKKKRQWKKFLPIALVAILFGSSLVAFTYTAGATQNVILRVVVFNVISGNFETVYSQQFIFQDNMTALQLLYMSNINFDYENDTIQCIGSFCNFEQQWEFLVNDQVIYVSPENFELQANDDVLFIYR